MSDNGVRPSSIQTEGQKQELRLIGVGYGRTGTNTMAEVLTQEFGIKCYRMFDVMNNKQDGKLWKELCECDPLDKQRKHELFDKIFRSSEGENAYLATVDWPACKFWRDLIEYYPNSKVLLTVRDPQKWYDSVKYSIYRYCQIINNSWLVASGIAKYIEPNMHYLSFINKYCILQGLKHEIENKDDSCTVSMFGNFDNREYVTNKFKKHIQLIKENVSKDRLIILDLSTQDGYNQLIEKFATIANRSPLDKQGEPLKHESAKNFHMQIRKLKNKMHFYDTIVIVILAILAYFVIRYFIDIIESIE